MAQKKEKLIQIPNTPGAQIKQKVIIDREGQAAKAIASAEPTKGKMIFVTDYPKTIAFAHTEGKKIIEKGDGVRIEEKIQAKMLIFENCMCETTDPVLIEAASQTPEQGNPLLGKAYYFHAKCVPESEKEFPRRIKDGARFMRASKDFIVDIKLAREKAKEFDPELHPEDGIEDNDPASEW